MSSILTKSHASVEIDHELISTVIESRRVVVSYKQKYLHKVLVKPLSQAYPRKKVQLVKLNIST